MGNNIIKLPFDGFKRLVDAHKKRIYYYIFSDGSVELNFISDSFIISTMILTNEIQDKNIFFQQQMFFKSEKLSAPMSIIKNIFDIFEEGSIDIVKKNQSEEQKQGEEDFNKEQNDTNI